MSFHQLSAPQTEPTAEESWALATMLEEEAKMTPCPPNLFPIYKVQVRQVLFCSSCNTAQVVDGSTRHPSIVEQEDFDIVTDFLETVVRKL